MQAISLKLEDSFLKDIERTMKNNRYTTKTEFIREAIRDKLNELEKQAALKRLKKMYGASKRRTTDADLHRAREEAVKELEKRFK